jgi:hypothetical protein
VDQFALETSILSLNCSGGLWRPPRDTRNVVSKHKCKQRGCEDQEIQEMNFKKKEKKRRAVKRSKSKQGRGRGPQTKPRG